MPHAGVSCCWPRTFDVHWAKVVGSVVQAFSGLASSLSTWVSFLEMVFETSNYKPPSAWTPPPACLDPPTQIPFCLDLHLPGLHCLGPHLLGPPCLDPHLPGPAPA